jgi:hypothetical protein
MKGVVFAEFLEMVGSVFSPEMVDRIIDRAKPPSGGAYTAVGFYDHKEIVALVGALSEATGTPAPDLVKAFGRYLFNRFVQTFPAFFRDVPDAFNFLAGIETRIHSEVRKLYPDAEVPSFACSSPAADAMILDYSSRRPFADLAEGLLEGCIVHFGGGIALARQDRPHPDVQARFTLTRTAA